MSWLSATQQWPDHPKPDARQALADARQSKFEFQAFAGHGFGRIRCGVQKHDPRHGTAIYTSGKGDRSGAAAAKAIRREITKCSRALARAGGAAPSSPPLPVGALVKVVRLVEAAELLEESIQAAELSDAALEEALQADPDDLTRSSESLDVASYHDQHAGEAAALARARLQASGEAFDTWPPHEGRDEVAQLAGDAIDDLRGRYELTASELEELAVLSERLSHLRPVP